MRCTPPSFSHTVHTFEVEWVERFEFEKGVRLVKASTAVLSAKMHGRPTPVPYRARRDMCSATGDTTIATSNTVCPSAGCLLPVCIRQFVLVHFHLTRLVSFPRPDVLQEHGWRP